MSPLSSAAAVAVCVFAGPALAARVIASGAPDLVIDLRDNPDGDNSFSSYSNAATPGAPGATTAG